ncbi:hypothetical protein D5R40_33040 [Okeania hirsuta]|uniref:Uncharacterized protein n=1 Tax=Okeania hirsuta TaxID=1458930 RepID=A0A3N6P644_9CYAN|nr:hypothetical protein D5R40_33040 [Okeania hirsuta]
MAAARWRWNWQNAVVNRPLARLSPQLANTQARNFSCKLGLGRKGVQDEKHHHCKQIYTKA